jgi:hypothetical protein
VRNRLKELQMSGKVIPLACLALALCGLTAAQEPSDAENTLINRLMQKAVLVTAMNVAHPETFQEDNDPNTLQIVFMSDPNSKAHVSDDGEVVFLPPNISVTDQGYLTHEAFRRKAVRIMQGKAPPPPGVTVPQ